MGSASHLGVSGLCYSRITWTVQQSVTKQEQRDNSMKQRHVEQKHEKGNNC